MPRNLETTEKTCRRSLKRFVKDREQQAWIAYEESVKQESSDPSDYTRFMKTRAEYLWIATYELLNDFYGIDSW